MSEDRGSRPERTGTGSRSGTGGRDPRDGFTWDFLLRARPLAVGGALGVGYVVVAESLPAARASELHALLLVFIAAVYLGFASADGRPRAVAIEIGGVALFCGMAVVGLWSWPPAWIFGYAGHALWDFLHHPHGEFGATIIGWYVPLCVVVDLLVAGYLAVELFA